MGQEAETVQVEAAESRRVVLSRPRARMLESLAGRQDQKPQSTVRQSSSYHVFFTLFSCRFLAIGRPMITFVKEEKVMGLLE